MPFRAELTTWKPAQHCLALHGKLDSQTCSTLETQAMALLAEPAATLVLDCTQLDYVASAGLRVFLMAAKQAQRMAGQLVLCGLQSSVREVIEISGFLRILTVADDVEQARALISA